MTGYLLAIGIGILVASAAAAGIQTMRLDAAQTEIADTVLERDVARAALETERRSRIVTEAALSVERRKAVAAEKRAADLKIRIARSVGTDQDGPAAPVLRDTIRSIGGAE